MLWYLVPSCDYPECCVFVRKIHCVQTPEYYGSMKIFKEVLDVGSRFVLGSCLWEKMIHKILLPGKMLALEEMLMLGVHPRPDQILGGTFESTRTQSENWRFGECQPNQGLGALACNRDRRRLPRSTHATRPHTHTAVAGTSAMDMSIVGRHRRGCGALRCRGAASTLRNT